MIFPSVVDVVKKSAANRWMMLGAFSFLGAGIFALAACGSDSVGVGDSKLPAGVRGEDVQHEDCAGDRTDVLDANGDGKPDIKRIYKGNKEVCRTTDLNHDGLPDLYEYFDASGQVRRREADYDGSGVVDAIEYYQNGKLARRELDTTGQHRIDTWDFFDVNTGKRIRRERDTTNDGRVDQWWSYDGDKVTIAFDKNNDGKPDPADTIVLNADATLATPASSSAPTDAGPPPSTASTMGALDAGNPLAPITPTPSAPDAGAHK
ncbi:MAG: hypothetical protein ABI183_10785 [Polyangiaceae bacterium]